MKNLLRIPSILLIALFLSIPFSSQAVPSKGLKKTEAQQAPKKEQKTKSGKQKKRHWFKSLFSSTKDKMKDRSGKGIANTALLTGALSNVAFYLFLKAISSNLLSITLFFAGPILGIAGIVLSIIALIRINKRKNSKTSRKAKRRAILGIVLSSLTIIICTLLFIGIRSITF